MTVISCPTSPLLHARKREGGDPQMSEWSHSSLGEQLLQNDVIFFFFFKFNVYLTLEYSWFTMLCYFQVYTKVIQLYIYTYPFYFRFFSHIGYYRILSRSSLCYTVGPCWLFCIYIYIFLAVLGLRCCARAFSSCRERELLFVAVRGLLILAACLFTEHGL